MIVRALDVNHDWTFGKGKSNYLKNLTALEQNINTRLNSFLGDCFFDIAAGIDWFNLIGGKSIASLELAVRTVIINTVGVTKLVLLNLNLDAERRLSLSYTVDTIYTTDGLPNGTLEVTSSYLLDQDGSILVTESGDRITV